MQQEERNESIKRLNQLKDEVRELRKNLNQINGQKEEWFKKKEDLTKNISKLIGDVRGLRTKRNSFSDEVKESKGKRQEYNELTRKKIEEIKKLNKEKSDVEKKFGIRENPAMIKAEIERLEMIIETQGINFEKEKEIMKKINELRKKAKESEKVSNIWNKSHILSKEIDELKAKSEEFHKKVQNTAKESQKEHEEMIVTSKEIDEMRKKEEEAFRNFVEFKKQFMEINNKLKEKLTEMGKIDELLGEFRKANEQEGKNNIQNILKEKEAIVEEKIKKGEKLTTEDLLILQGAEK